jgi:hypothetical protein
VAVASAQHRQGLVLRGWQTRHPERQYLSDVGRLFVVLVRQLDHAEANQGIVEDLAAAGSPATTIDVLLRLNPAGDLAEVSMCLEERPTLVGRVLPLV